MKKTCILLITLMSLLLVLPGCSSNTSSNSSTSSPYSDSAASPTNGNQPTTGTLKISIKGFSFSPQALSINKGDTVTWTNEDTAVHNVVGGPLKSKDLAKGQSFSYTFTDSGSYDYICTYHPSMKGKIVVK